MKQIRLITRIALFAAIIYVLSWGTSYFPNLNLIFFIVFTSGLLWGLLPGILVGAIGMGLWTMFNPFGAALPPIMISQVFGASLSGVIGYLFSKTNWQANSGKILKSKLIIASICCTVLFYLPVTIIDAWLFQPFWPRFISGIPWVGISLVTNIIIFPLLFKVSQHLYEKECSIKL